MDEMQTPEQLEDRAARAGLTRKQMCGNAELKLVTWHRWKRKGEIPKASKPAYYRLLRAIEKAERALAEREERAAEEAAQ